MAAELAQAEFIIDPTSGEILGIRSGGDSAYFSNTPGATGVISTYTAAQLAAMALAGTLTPYATHVASDESPYQQWALDASTLGSPLGGEYVTVQVAGASGGVVEI